ncbi:MAG: hypothetical protein M3179_10605 [Actinomycetota bacterium]|nr:hypothetical protein [Actinomycetota bacterium]
MARIVDTVPEFEAFAKSAGLEIPIRREMLWKDRYQKAHREVFEAFFAAAGPPEGIPAMMRELSRVRERVAEAAPIMRAHIDDVDPRLADVLGRPAEPAPVHVLMVGTFATNAVVGRLGDDVAVFHCLEWFQSVEGSKVLVAHEGAHAWHRIALAEAGTGGEGTAEDPPEEDVDWLAFSEGFAIAASRAAVPDRPEVDYFWYGHPEVEDWLPWCRDRREEIIDLFRSSLDDPKAFDTFFGAGFVQGKWRVGYFVADELVKGLGLSLQEMATTSVADGKAAIRRALGVE